MLNFFLLYYIITMQFIQENLFSIMNDKKE